MRSNNEYNQKNKLGYNFFGSNDKMYLMLLRKSYYQ